MGCYILLLICHVYRIIKTIYYTKTERKEFFFNLNVIFIWNIYVRAYDEESISIDKTFYNSSSYRIAFLHRWRCIMHNKIVKPYVGGFLSHKCLRVKYVLYSFYNWTCVRKSARGKGKMFENVYTRLRSFGRTTRR